MKKHRIAVIVLLAFTAIVHFGIERAQAQAGMARTPQEVLRVPSKVGSYSQMGSDHEIDARVREILETSLIMERTYRSPNGFLVALSIVHAGSSRRSLHFPEVCIVGAGYEIRDQQSMPIGFEFNAARLTVSKGPYRQAILYWYKTGDKVTGNFFLNSWYWAKNQLVFGAPTSSMIKLSAAIPGTSDERVFAELEDFALKLHPMLMDAIE